MTLEEAYRRGCRVEITFKEGQGWVIGNGSTVRGRVSKSAGRTPIYILLRRIDSMGGYQVSEDEVESIREVNPS